MQWSYDSSLAAFRNLFATLDMHAWHCNFFQFCSAVFHFHYQRLDRAYCLLPIADLSVAFQLHAKPSLLSLTRFFGRLFLGHWDVKLCMCMLLMTVLAILLRLPSQTYSLFLAQKRDMIDSPVFFSGGSFWTPTTPSHEMFQRQLSACLRLSNF